MLFASACCRAGKTALAGRKGPRGDGGHGRQVTLKSPSDRIPGLASLKRLTQKLVGLKGESESLESRLEEAEMEAALNEAAATEMQLALEEEISFHKEAQRMLGYHFVGAQSGYNELMTLFEVTKANHSQEFQDLTGRLDKSLAAQKKAETSVSDLKIQLTKLTKRCKKLQEETEVLSAKLCKANSANKALQDQVAEQASMIKELLNLQEEGQQRRQILLQENEMLRKRLEIAERQVAVLLDP